MTDYLELAKATVNKAAQNGVEVEVIITQDKETQVRVSGGEVEQLSQSGSGGMGVRVIQDGRTGYAYTSDLSDDSIEQTWRTATELAQVATPDAYRGLPDPQPIPDEDLEIWDASMQDVPTDRKIELLRQIEQATLDYDERVVATQWCTYQDATSHVYLANSRGFGGQYGRTTAAAYLMAVARDADGHAATAFGVGASNFFDDLNAEDIGHEAASKSISILGGKPVETHVGTVVLDHFVGAQIIAAISGALTAESWQKKRSFLLDRMGQTVGSDMVTLLDNGRMKRGLASAPFDGEGVPTSATRLVDEGVLQNLIYDSYSARKDNRASTGNAQRNGHRGMPSLGPSNFYIQPGNMTRDEIIAGVEKGFLVLSGMQTGGIDPVTGDCSMSAAGLWIENGEITGPVDGVTIATTLNDFLMNITAVGNDLRMMPLFGIIGVPTLRVDHVTIGGS